MARVRRRRDAGRVAGRRAEQRRPADVDHLDRLVDADELDPDRRRERLDVDDDEIDRRDALRLELGELVGHVAAGEDPRIDRVVERLDLAADRADRPSVSSDDGGDLDAFAGEVLARAVGGEDLDVEVAQVPGERRDALPVRD